MRGRTRGTRMCRYVVVVMFLIAGCSATVKHQEVSDDAKERGVRYYDSAPYLIVYSDGLGGLKWQIRYLPDQSRLMAANPTIQGARTEMTLYFQNGMLASASTVGDTTEIPKALIGAVQSALPLLAGVPGAAIAEKAGEKNVDEHVTVEKARPKGFPSPYLYKLVVRNNTVLFIGDQGKTKIQVPLQLGKQ